MYKIVPMYNVQWRLVVVMISQYQSQFSIFTWTSTSFLKSTSMLTSTSMSTNTVNIDANIDEDVSINVDFDVDINIDCQTAIKSCYTKNMKPYWQSHDSVDVDVACWHQCRRRHQLYGVAEKKNIIQLKAIQKEQKRSSVWLSGTKTRVFHNWRR